MLRITDSLALLTLIAITGAPCAVTVVDPPVRLLVHPGSANPALLVTRGVNGTVLWLSGEQDIATRAELRNVLASEFDADDGDVIVDLAGVTFIDGSTLGALIHARRRMSERNRWLTVRAPSRSAQRLLELCGLTGLLESRGTADHARVVADAKVDGTDYGF